MSFNSNCRILAAKWNHTFTIKTPNSCIVLTLLMKIWDKYFLVTWVITVAAGVKRSVFASYAGAPTIVYDDAVLHGGVVEEPRQEIGRIPVPVLSSSIAIRPNYLRLVLFNLYKRIRKIESPNRHFGIFGHQNLFLTFYDLNYFFHQFSRYRIW